MKWVVLFYLDGLFAGQRCFASDSFVTLADGKPKQISELQSGDLVLAYNDQTKQVVSTPVITILHNQPTQFSNSFHSSIYLEKKNFFQLFSNI